MSVVVRLPSASMRKLHLYIAGETPATFRARSQCAALKELVGGIEIEEVDVLIQPNLAETAAILATPTLSDDAMAPPRRIVGDLGDVGRIVQFLGLESFNT